jgi:heme-degrading monooxygenase HmoA
MITRMILVNVPAEKIAEAERLWKEDCGALLIEQPGCKSEQLLRNRENPGEFISLSTWDNQEVIDRYRISDAHRTIQQHTRALMNVAKVQVKTYEVVG